MSDKSKRWTMPNWMEPFRSLICNTGGNSIEAMMDGNADPRVNLPLSTLQAAVKSQVYLLEKLHSVGMLSEPTTPKKKVPNAKTVKAMRGGIAVKESDSGDCHD